MSYYSSSSSSTPSMLPTPSKKTLAIVAAATVVVLTALVWYSDLYLGTHLRNFLHIYALPLMIFVASAAVAGVTLFFERFYLAAFFAGLAVLGPIGVGMYGDYLAQQTYAADVKITEDAVPSFGERTAWEISRNRVASDKTDLVGSVVTPRYFSAEEKFTTLVEGVTFTAGYAGVVEQTIALDGSTTAVTCTFGDGTGKGGYRLGGNLDGSLEREISHLDRGLVIDDGDAYGYCDGETAVAVVPLKKLQGFYPVTQVPAGVAVYRDGQVTLVRDVAAGDIPGPVYPISLAAEQRASLDTINSTWWTWMTGKAGYTEATTAGDPNSENPTEFALQADAPVFVTPMTTQPKQEEAKITSYTVIAADAVTAGSRTPLVLHKVPADQRREANGVVVDDIKSFYSDADYGWAQELKVFEMLPTSATEWVASLGFEKSVKFRVRLAADGSSCIEDGAGIKIQCVDETGQVVSGGNTATDTPSDTPSDTSDGSAVDPASPLAEMTSEELAELQKAIAEEMLTRIDSGATSGE